MEEQTSTTARRLQRATLALLAGLVLGALLAAPASAWTPEPASYGLGSTTNVPVTMSDGTVLQANVYYPTDPATGREATGTFR